jgi:carbonic anhydrase
MSAARTAARTTIPSSNAVAEKNVHLTVQDVLDQGPVLREMAAKKQIRIVGAMLDVQTAK